MVKFNYFSGSSSKVKEVLKNFWLTTMWGILKIKILLVRNKKYLY